MFGFINALQPRHWRELGRFFRNHKYEYSDDGDLLIAHATIRGELETTAPDGLGTVVSHNLWTTEGFNHILSVAIGSGTQYANWYIAPFSGNITVVDTLTAATFASATTELTTQYVLSNAGTTRALFEESIPASKSTSNTANPAVLVSTADNINIWGVGLLSSSTKGGTSGVLLSAAKYSTVRSLPTTGDTLGVKYTLTFANQA